jgi:hypothetical protein
MDERAAGWLAEERLTHLIIGAFVRVYNTLGFGFLEHVYGATLERELLRRGGAAPPFRPGGEVLPAARTERLKKTKPPSAQSPFIRVIATSTS